MTRKGKNAKKKDRPENKRPEGDLAAIGLDEVAYMLMLSADLTARSNWRIPSTQLFDLGEPSLDGGVDLLVTKIGELRALIGWDAPIFPQPYISTEPGLAHEMFQECFELACQMATEEMRAGV